MLATPAQGKAAENLRRNGWHKQITSHRPRLPASDRPADKEQLLAAPLGFPSSFVHRSMNLGEGQSWLGEGGFA